jgi:hypothetical protein
MFACSVGMTPFINFQKVNSYAAEVPLGWFTLSRVCSEYSRSLDS